MACGQILFYIISLMVPIEGILILTSAIPSIFCLVVFPLAEINPFLISTSIGMPLWHGWTGRRMEECCPNLAFSLC
jgi:cytochrome b561